VQASYQEKMSMNIKLGLMMGALGLLAVESKAMAADPVWIHTVKKSCYQACDERSLQPVASGNWKDGVPFYVCSAQDPDQTVRPGWNLASEDATLCVYAYGNKLPFANEEYNCLCF
jgi:hypothetical protein